MTGFYFSLEKTSSDQAQQSRHNERSARRLATMYRARGQEAVAAQLEGLAESCKSLAERCEGKTHER